MPNNKISRKMRSLRRKIKLMKFYSAFRDKLLREHSVNDLIEMADRKKYRIGRLVFFFLPKLAKEVPENEHSLPDDNI